MSHFSRYSRRYPKWMKLVVAGGIGATGLLLFLQQNQVTTDITDKSILYSVFYIDNIVHRYTSTFFFLLQSTSMCYKIKLNMK